MRPAARAPVTAEPPAYSRLAVAGHAYAYVDAGDRAGPPVVMVHGNPTWSYYYRTLIRSLGAAGYRCLAPDHVGMGRSAKPPAADYPYTLRRRIEDFGAWLDQVLPAGALSLVVHDWGGAIALGWAVEHPERVQRLVLLNTAAFTLPEGKRLPLALRLARTRPLGDLAVLHANAFARGAARVAMTRRRMPAEVRRAYLAPYDRPAHRVGVLRFVRDIPLRPGDPAYQPLRRTEERLSVLADRPVLICWGMRDFVFDAEILARWEQIYPRAEVHRIQDAGHYVLEDAAADVVPLVVDFLGRSADPAGPTR